MGLAMESMGRRMGRNANYLISIDRDESYAVGKTAG